MAESESADGMPIQPDADLGSTEDTPAVGTGRRPRPVGDTAAMPQVQLALGLLILFLFLLVLWVVWPILSNS